MILTETSPCDRLVICITQNFALRIWLLIIWCFWTDTWKCFNQTSKMISNIKPRHEIISMFWSIKACSFIWHAIFEKKKIFERNYHKRSNEKLRWFCERNNSWLFVYETHFECIAVHMIHISKPNRLHQFNLT